MEGRRRALLSVPFGYASLHCEQGTPIPLANDLQLFNFRWQSLFKFGWQWTEGRPFDLEGLNVVCEIDANQSATEEDARLLQRDFAAMQWDNNI